MVVGDKIIHITTGKMVPLFLINNSMYCNWFDEPFEDCKHSLEVIVNDTHKNGF